MKRVLATLVPVLFGLAVPMGALEGQLMNAPLPGEGDLGTVSLHFGTVDPRTTFDDGSRFQRGTAVGVSGTIWAFRNLGFRGNVTKSQNDGHNPQDPEAAIAVQDPDVWLYSGEAVLRLPIITRAVAVTPFLSGGIGGKTWDWKVKTIADVERAWTGALGLDFRPLSLGRVGLVTEARAFRSQFHAFGYRVYYWHEAAMGIVEGEDAYWGKSTHHNDLVVTVGLSLNF